jgi:outer membrane protein OmpA-like peptidoglycan-associated protein
MKAKFLVAISAVALLGACSHMNIPGVRAMADQGDAFDAALHQNYADLAQAEFDEADWQDARYFTDRSKMAAAGVDKGPQPLAERNIPATNVSELTVARADLVAALDAGAKTQSPEAAAKAQSSFDCWMQEQEENIQPKDISDCRTAFYEAMKVIAPEMKKADAKPAASMKKPEKMAMPVPMNVYFSFDSAKLDTKAQAVIRGVLAAEKKYDPAHVKLTGYTDRAGNPTYNDVLAKERVDAVSKALWSNGVKPSKLEISISGEANPPIPTKDGIRESRNRVVVIEFTNDN